MFFLQPLNVFDWILKRIPAFGKACCQATIIIEILSRNDDFGFGRVARSNKTFGCCKLIHTTNKLWPVPQCQNFNQTRPPNPFFTTCPGMTKLKTLISKTFVLLWTVIYDIKFIQFRIRGISAIIELVDHFCNSILPASYSQGLPGRLQYCIVQFTGASRAKLTLFLWSKY